MGTCPVSLKGTNPKILGLILRISDFSKPSCTLLQIGLFCVGQDILQMKTNFIPCILLIKSTSLASPKNHFNLSVSLILVIHGHDYIIDETKEYKRSRPVSIP